MQLVLRWRSYWAEDGRVRDPASVLIHLPDEVDRLKRLGADLIEIPAEVCSLDHRYESAQLWQEFAAVLRDRALGATLHLPSLWVDLASLDRHIWESSVRSVQVALEATLPLAPVVAVTHPGNHASEAFLQGRPESRRTSFFHRMIDQVTSALQRLRESPGGRILAVENLEGTPVEIVAQVARNAGVGLCLDVGHAIVNGEDPAQCVSAAADLLLAVHLHDATPSATPVAPGKAHLPLGEGVLDLNRFVSSLIQCGFSGPVVIEDRGDPTISAARFRTAVADLSPHR